jgi:hypothetical protein
MSAPKPDGSGFDIQAMQQIFLGDSGWDGTISPNGDDWKSFGYDVDGLHFTDACQAQYHCQLQQGGDAQHEIIDGPAGLDNSFGQNVLPVLSSFASTPSDSMTLVLGTGVYTYAFRVEKLGAGSSYQDLHGEVFPVRGADSSGMFYGPIVPPTPSEWTDGSYVWHPFADFLVDPTLVDPAMYQSTQSFDTGYLTGNQWVSGTQGTVRLRLNLSGAVIDMDIVHAIVTLDLSADHSTGSHGILSGIVSAQKLASSVGAVAGDFGLNGCAGAGSTINSISAEILMAADINLDGAQHPDQPCDGISIGIGFTTVSAMLGDPAPALGTYDPCSTGG